MSWIALQASFTLALLVECLPITFSKYSFWELIALIFVNEGSAAPILWCLDALLIHLQSLGLQGPQKLLQ